MNTHNNLKELFDDIADAIRFKKRITRTIIADNFPDEIRSIQSSGRYQSKIVNTNGIVTPDSGYDGLSQVTVNVSFPSMQTIVLKKIDFDGVTKLSYNTKIVNTYDMNVIPNPTQFIMSYTINDDTV